MPLSNSEKIQFFYSIEVWFTRKIHPSKRSVPSGNFFFEIEVIICCWKKSEFDTATWAQFFKKDNFTLLKNTFIGNVHLVISLELNRNSDKRVWIPLNLILILFLFQDLPIEGVLRKKSIKIGEGTSLRSWSLVCLFLFQFLVNSSLFS